MIVSMIAAVARNGTIGRDNGLPWQIAQDMRFFMRLTRGRTVLTGRRNFEAMGGPLPHRDNIVLTRNPGYVAPGARVSSDLESALRLAEADRKSEVFVIGGAELYRAAKPYAHRYYRTTVLADVVGDVRYDDDDWEGWEVQPLGGGEVTAENEYAFRIDLLTRVGAPRGFNAPNSPSRANSA
jgi:dihydrofolate reductase